jgi:hypothetical protein
MQSLREKLYEKGWDKEEIEKTVKIFEEGRNKKSKTILFIDWIAYWSALIIAIIGNMVLSVLLIPFLLVASSSFLYPALAIIGIAFGFVFNIILKDIEQIEKTKHIIIGMFLPALALINVYIITQLSNHLAYLMKLPYGVHKPVIVSIVYSVSFVIPYVITQLLKRAVRKPSLHKKSF